MGDIAFSVIVPCYNVEKYVVHCVEKLQQQTFKDMEIILIDDGSTDDTFALCKEMAKKYDNVVSITHDYSEQEATRNRGQEATRNRGLEATRGRWVCFLDADDELEDDALQYYKETFEQCSDVDMILTGLAFVYEDGTPDRNAFADISQGIYSSKEIAENAFNRIPWVLMSCIGTKVYKREFIEKNHLRFDIRYKFNEDGAFAIKAFWQAEKIAYFPKPMYRYLQRAGSIMHSYRNNAFESLNRVNDLLEEYFNHYGVLSEKESYILRRRWSLIYSVLSDEAAYKGRKSFTSLFVALRNNEGNIAVCTDRSVTDTLTTFSKIQLLLFRRRMCWLMYICIKFRILLLKLHNKKA